MFTIRVRRRASLSFVLLVLLVGLATQGAFLTSAQEETPTEIPMEILIPTETATPLPTDVPTSTPTDIPTSTPTEIVVETATLEPTFTPTTESTAEVSATPTETPSELPTETPFVTPEATETDEAPAELLPAYSTNFDAGFPAELGSGSGWLPVTMDVGQAVQYSDGAETALYTAATFTDSAVEAKVLLHSGDVTLLLRKSAAGEYRAVLSVDATDATAGTLRLYKNDELVNTGSLTLTPDTWITLKFSAVGGALSALIDGVERVDAVDLAPMPSGQAGFAASAGGLVRLDDFALYGTSDGVPAIETPVATVEATAEVTAEATADVTREPGTAPVIRAASVNCPTPATAIRIVSQNAGVQVTALAGQNQVSVSADGRYSIFATGDSTMVGGDTNSKLDVFRYDRNTCTVVRVSVPNTGGQPDGDSVVEQISDDGNLVLMSSKASNLLATTVSGGFSQVYVRNMNAGTNSIISTDGGGVPGNQDSSHASMSDNGNYIAYVSRATNLVAGDTNDFCDNDANGSFSESCADVFVWNWNIGSVQRVSVANGGGQADGPVSTVSTPQISNDGSTVVFVSYATNLTPEGVNNCPPGESISLTFCPEVYMNRSGSVTRLSVSSSGAVGDSGVNYLHQPLGMQLDMTPDGRYVVFSSLATNLVIGDTNNTSDIFLRDTVLNTTTRVSLTRYGQQIGGGEALSPSISDNGDLIGFASSDNSIMGGSGMSWQFYAHSMSMNQTTRLSGVSPVTPGNNSSMWGAVADGGVYAVFSSDATNLVTGDANNALDAFEVGINFPATPGTSTFFSNTQTGITFKFTDNSADEANFRIERMTSTSWTEIGTVAAVPNTGGQATFTDSSLRCGQVAQYRVRVFRASDGLYSAYSPVLQASTANCAAPPACNPNLPIARLSTGPNGVPQSLGESSNVTSAISANGQYIVFSSAGNNLVAGDADFTSDVFRYNRLTCQSELVSIGYQGNPNGASAAGSTTPDGQTIVFTSQASDMVAGDSNGVQDIFLRNIPGGYTQLISKSFSGPTNGPSFEPHISPDGNFVVFTSNATNINGLDSDPGSDVYLYKRLDDITMLISFNIFSAEGGNSPSSRPFVVNGPLPSPFVVFYTTAGNIIGDDSNGVGDVAIRDTYNGRTYRVSATDDDLELNGDSRPTMVTSDATNIYVVFESRATNLGSNPMTCDSDFNGIFNDPCYQVYLRTFPFANMNGLHFTPDGTTTLISRATGVSGAPAGATGIPSFGSFGGSVSQDIRYVTFESSASNLVAGDTNGKTDVFVRDTLLNTTTRLSNGNDTSSSAALSGFGQYVAFTSLANNLVTGDTNTFCQLDLDPQFEECADVFVVPVSSAVMGNPGALTATTNLPTQINLSWVAIANVDGYQLWRDTGTGAQLLTTLGGMTYTDNNGGAGMTCGLSATYTVRGYRTTGSLFTPYSNAVIGKTVACAAPALTAPDANAQVQTTTLQWGSVSNSLDNYEVLVSTDAAGLLPAAGYPVSISGGTSHSILIGNLPDGIYYWKVRVHNTDLNDHSGPYSAARTLIIDTQPLASVPTPLIPANYGTVDSARPTFTWMPVTGAAFYQIEVALDNTFNLSTVYVSPPPGTPGAITSTPFTIPASFQALAQGEYFWRVRAYDKALNVGSYSTETPRFIVNLMKLPADHATLVIPGSANTATVTFTWAAVTGAFGYKVQIDVNDDDGNFSDYSCTPSPITALSCTLSGVAGLSEAKYGWRLVVTGEAAFATHPVRHLVVTHTIPTAPSLGSPAANDVFSNYTPDALSDVGFSWSNAAVKATLEIDDSPTFNTVLEYTVTTTLTGGASVDMSGFAPGRYYWRVKGVTVLGVVGPPSAVRSFVIDTTPPAVAPTQLLLAEGATINTVLPTFTYTAVTDPSTPVTYQVDISTRSDAEFDNHIVDTIASSTTSAKALSVLPAQGTFYWRVTAFDHALNSVTNGNIRSFKFNISNLPANNAVAAPGNVMFSWMAVPGTTSYHVEIDLDGDGDFTAGSTVPPACSNVIPPAVSCVTSLSAGTYPWRVMSNVLTNDGTSYRVLYVKAGAGLPAPSGLHLDGTTTGAPYKNDTYLNFEEKNNGIQLVWDAPVAVTGLTVDHYEVQFSTTATFSSFETLSTATTTMAPSVGIMASDGVKYARVRALYAPDGAAGANSPTFTFTVDTQIPAPPTLISPAAGHSSLAPLKPTLTWSAVTGIAATNGYRLDIATNFNMTTPALPGSLDMSVTKATYTVPTELGLGSLFWRVRAVDVAGNTSASSQHGDFMVFLGTAPAQSAVNQAVRPTFTWQKQTGITQYTLDISRDGDTSFTGNIFSQLITSSLPTISFTYPAAQPALTDIIYWRVYAQGVTPPAGYYASFAVTNGLTAPTLNSPIAGAVVNAAAYPTAQLSWNAPVQGAGVYNYHIEVASNPAFTGAIEVGFSSPSNSTTLNLSPALDSQPDGLKYWRVRAEYMPGAILGPYSAIRTFTLDKTPPDAPINLNVNFGTNPSRPTLNWKAVVGVAATNGYQVDVSQDNFSTLLAGFPQSRMTPSFVFTSNLEQGTYQYRVRSVDAAGNISTDSSTFIFVVNVAKTPANNAVVNAPASTVNQVFSWFAVPNATSYKVEIDTDGNGDFSPGALLTCLPTPATGLTCTAAGLARGTYAWRVVVNGVNPPPEIKNTLFVINGTALPAPSLPAVTETGATPPYLNDNLINAIEKANGVNINWTAPTVIGATIVSYELQFGTNATFTPVLDSVNNVVGLSEPIPGGVLTNGVRYVRVRAIYAGNNGNVAGAFSAVRMFTVDGTAPNPPMLTTPKGNLIVTTHMPTLTFAAAPTAVRYRVEVATSAGFGVTTLITATVAIPKFIVPNAQELANGSTFWRVTAIDGAGNESVVSDTASFFVNAP